MRVIGLTGGIGSGKSTIAGILKELGVAAIDADSIGHQVLEEDSEARQQVIGAFGQGVVAPDGGIDRRKLGDTVFGDTGALSRLNRIMHPRIDRVVEEQLERYRRQGVDTVVVEAPLLVEAGWEAKVDEVWVTTAPEAIILKRLGKLGLSHDEAMARIRSQITDEERAKHADVVIDTDCSLDELRAKVAELRREM